MYGGNGETQRLRPADYPVQLRLVRDLAVDDGLLGTLTTRIPENALPSDSVGLPSTRNS